MNDEISDNPAPTTPTAARPALRDRVLGWRGVAAVALASVVLGGAGGAVLGAVSDGDSVGPGRMGGPGAGGLPGNRGQVPMGVPGQLPPSTAPQQGQGSAGS